MVNPVSPAVLAQIRAISRRYLTDQCSIERMTEDTDPWYGGEAAWEEVYTAVPCRIIRATNTRSGAYIAAVQESLRDSFSFEFAHDQPIAAGDRINHNGTIFEIQRIQDVLTDAVFKSVLVTRLS